MFQRMAQLAHPASAPRSGPRSQGLQSLQGEDRCPVAHNSRDRTSTEARFGRNRAGPRPGSSPHPACGPHHGRAALGQIADAKDTRSAIPVLGMRYDCRFGDRLKLLYWDGQGFCLYYKVLQKGRFLWCIFPRIKCLTVVARAPLLRMMRPRRKMLMAEAKSQVNRGYSGHGCVPRNLAHIPGCFSPTAPTSSRPCSACQKPMTNCAWSTTRSAGPRLHGPLLPPALNSPGSYWSIPGNRAPIISVAHPMSAGAILRALYSRRQAVRHAFMAFRRGTIPRLHPDR